MTRVMNASELRRRFTDFFVGRGHTLVPSASLIPHDETLLFTNAGMVPFKPYFQGLETPPWPRATTVQKCVRAGGKHNDLDEVGRTSRHLTFFEMLGNFSFGDYFKAEAIPYAWTFFTDELGLDADRLWVTVHLSDDEAAELWHDLVGVPSERIQRLDADNWWRMADTGPNGPCSEIFFDKGAQHGADGGPAEGGEERFVEIWNLVFMQFDDRPDGTKVPLPAPSIDTGAGLERVTSVLQGVSSVWEIDEFVRLLDHVAQATGLSSDRDDRAEVSLRILADHARSSTFLVSDGVFPSNEERGYALRRIIRRAIRHAYLLGVDTQVMASLVDGVIDVMGDDYADVVENRDYICDVLDREEGRFRQTLASGSQILDDELDTVSQGGRLAGSVAFMLHDTYGFPLEVTEEIAIERGVTVDLDGFDREMAAQRDRAKADHAAKQTTAGGDERFLELQLHHGDTDFVGRDLEEAEATVLAVVGDSVVLDRTPFYAESGGQIGDTGTIRQGETAVPVVDTQNVAGGLIRHMVGDDAERLVEGQEVVAAIDRDRRAAIKRHHTATHILHWALREVLGDHVKQQGSWVGPDRLRFDFSHYEAVSEEQLAAIEDLANSEILTNAPVHHYETTMDDARERGAIAFFGDKYGDRVRVLEAGEHSIELCGGTHVGALGDIGLVKIIAEGSIGSNLRRIEAVAGAAPVERLREETATLEAAADLLGVARDDIVDAIGRQSDELKAMRAELTRLSSAAAVGRAGELAATAIDGVVVAQVDDVDRNGLRDLAAAVRDKGVDLVVLGAVMDSGGAALVSAANTEAGFDAGKALGDAAKLVKGGGRPDPAMTVIGGKQGDRIGEALDHVRSQLSV